MISNRRRLSLAVLVLWAVAARADEPTTNAGPEVSITPSVTYVTVSGDEKQFREDQGIKNGWVGGVDEATLHQSLGKDASLDFEGRGLFDQHDYKLQLEIVKPDLGFVRAGFTEWRKYYDDTGGFFGPITPPAFSLDRNLHLDNANIFVDVGLTLPNLPKIVFGYERQSRNGDQSLLEWGSVTQGTTSRKIYPSYQSVDETVNIFKVSVEQDIGKVHVGDQFRYEHYNDDTKKFDTSLNLDTSASQTVTIHEDYRHDSFYNTFLMNCQVNPKLYVSLGYMYNTLNGNNDLQVITPPPLGPFSMNWMTQNVDVGLDSNVVDLNAVFGSFAGLSVYSGLQVEVTDSHGFSRALQTEGVSPTATNVIHSSNNMDSFEETLGLRYTKIAYTTLYAEGRWTEQDIDLNERETVDGSSANPGAFARDTDTGVTRQDYSIGFNSSPMRRLTLSARYRHSIYNNDYDNEVDTEPGYPAFITGQDFTTDEVMGRLNIRPCSRFSLAFTYQLVATEIQTDEGGIPSLVPKGSKQTCNYDSSIYSVSATVTPISRLYLTGLFSYQDTRTSTFDNHSPTVVPYKGTVYSIITTAGYALDKKTDITLEYLYERADDFQNNSADGLPLGLENQRTGVLVGLQRKITEHFIARLRYGYYENNESSNGGINNYRANLVSASCTARF